MSAATPTRSRSNVPGEGGEPAAPVLPCTIRGADGRERERELTAGGHRALQLSMLHQETPGYVELAAGRRSADGVAITTRRRPDHFLPGGAGGVAGWLEALLALAARHHDDGEEVFVAAACRREPAAGKAAVDHSRWLWVDVDRADRLDAVWAFAESRPAHLMVASGGSGGVHVYWRLDWPLPAQSIDRRTGEVVDWIERANDRIIHALGVDADGHPEVADRACRDRSRVMRLAGTRNYKTGRHARIIRADVALAPYAARALVGDLPDPDTPTARARRHVTAPSMPDRFRSIAADEYFRVLAGIAVPVHGPVRCPNPRHRDSHPSCSVSGSVFHCHGCGEGGGIYDLASLLDGGPTGAALRGEQFKRAAARINAAFGEHP